MPSSYKILQEPNISREWICCFSDTLTKCIGDHCRFDWLFSADNVDVLPESQGHCRSIQVFMSIIHIAQWSSEQTGKLSSWHRCCLFQEKYPSIQPTMWSTLKYLLPFIFSPFERICLHARTINSFTSFGLGIQKQLFKLSQSSQSRFWQRCIVILETKSTNVWDEQLLPFGIDIEMLLARTSDAIKYKWMSFLHVAAVKFIKIRKQIFRSVPFYTVHSNKASRRIYSHINPYTDGFLSKVDTSKRGK